MIHISKYRNKAFYLVVLMTFLCVISSCTKSESDMILSDAEDMIVRGELDEAISECNMIISDEPENSQAYRIRGDARLEKMEFEPAIEDYTKAIELDGENYPAIGGRGSAYGCTGELENAIVDFSVMIEAFPDDPENWFVRGMTYMQLDMGEQAISDLERVLELDPSHARARKMLNEANSMD